MYGSLRIIIKMLTIRRDEKMFFFFLFIVKILMNVFIF